jgi:hypothetical protein
MDIIGREAYEAIACEQNIWKLNNLNVFGSKKTKGSKRHSQNNLSTPMPEEAEP